MKQNFIYTLVLLGIIIFLVAMKRRSKKNASWKGELIKKKDITDEDDENHVYRLIFKTDSGKTEKVSMTETVYNDSKVGDRYEKLSGTNSPHKIS